MYSKRGARRTNESRVGERSTEAWGICLILAWFLPDSWSFPLPSGQKREWVCSRCTEWVTSVQGSLPSLHVERQRVKDIENKMRQRNDRGSSKLGSEIGWTVGQKHTEYGKRSIWRWCYRVNRMRMFGSPYCLLTESLLRKHGTALFLLTQGDK